MKYINTIDLEVIRKTYNNIIAWGGGMILSLNYYPNYFHVDFIIDGKKNNIGKKFRGIEIKSEDAIMHLIGKTLIIIYTIYEKEVLVQLEKYENKDIDTIIYPLLTGYGNFSLCSTYAKSGEDILLGILLKYLGIDNLTYLEIGVCHPIMRNNTYALREYMKSTGGTCRGVLVEANPIWYDLIEEYRPDDTLLKCGISEKAEKKILYVFPNRLGHSTFIMEQAEEEMNHGGYCEQRLVNLMEINSVIGDNFDRVPDLLALDAEGMDCCILKAWDNVQYPFKIVVAELSKDVGNSMMSLMNDKGYSLYARTPENGIWITKRAMSNMLDKQM